MAKKLITKQQIIDAAYSLAEQFGMEGVNMRSIAERCGCSTQPIYLSFANAEQLKQAVTDKIVRTYRSYINSEIASGRYPEYKASGMAYIRFAKEKPQLFKYLFMRNRSGELSDEPATDFEQDAQRARQYGLNASGATKMHTHMWIYVHGIATMYATGYLDWDWQTVSSLLTEEFTAVAGQMGLSVTPDVTAIAPDGTTDISHASTQVVTTNAQGTAPNAQDGKNGGKRSGK